MVKSRTGEKIQNFSLFGQSRIQEFNEFIGYEKDHGKKVYLPKSDSEEKTAELEILPYIAVVIDDYCFFRKGHNGDIDSKIFCEMIAELSQNGKAAGIHIILSTKDFSKENINRDILTNLPSNMVLIVDNSLQSRLIIDEFGAEDLMGYGDLILRFPRLKDTMPLRVHGAYIDRDDISYLVESWLHEAGAPKFVMSSTAAVNTYACADNILEKIRQKRAEPIYNIEISNSEA